MCLYGFAFGMGGSACVINLSLCRGVLKPSMILGDCPERLSVTCKAVPRKELVKCTSTAVIYGD